MVIQRSFNFQERSNVLKRVGITFIQIIFHQGVVNINMRRLKFALSTGCIMYSRATKTDEAYTKKVTPHSTLNELKYSWSIKLLTYSSYLKCISRTHISRTIWNTSPLVSKSEMGNIFITYWDIYVYVCLEFYVHARIFHSYGNVTITGEGLQILIYARHIRLLSSEGSLACHTYCGHPFIIVIS